MVVADRPHQPATGGVQALYMGAAPTHHDPCGCTYKSQGKREVTFHFQCDPDPLYVRHNSTNDCDSSIGFKTSKACVEAPTSRSWHVQRIGWAVCLCRLCVGLWSLRGVVRLCAKLREAVRVRVRARTWCNVYVHSCACTFYNLFTRRAGTHEAVCLHPSPPHVLAHHQCQHTDRHTDTQTDIDTQTHTHATQTNRPTDPSHVTRTANGCPQHTPSTS